MFTIKLKGIDSIDDTKPLMEKMCYREVVGGESNDEEGYFVKDLIGLQVIDELGNDLGTLKEVFQTGANDVYEIVKDNKSIYIPAIKNVVLDIDINSKVMKIKLMEGLV